MTSTSSRRSRIVPAILVMAVILAGAWLWIRSWPMDVPPASASGIDEATLSGVPVAFVPALDAARLRGAPALREWMLQHEKRCLDPRLGWIQLEYAALVRNTKPAEAKVYFEMVKARTPTNSPILPRIRQLEPAFR